MSVEVSEHGLNGRGRCALPPGPRRFQPSISTRFGACAAGGTSRTALTSTASRAPLRVRMLWLSSATNL